LASRAPGGRARLPRFLPPDPRIEEPYLLTPRTALRVAVLGAVSVGVFAVLLLRLWGLQILSGSHYLNAALNNQLRSIRVDAKRGPILDANGRVLVTNVRSQAVVLWPADLPKRKGRSTELSRLAEVLHLTVPWIQAKIRQHANDPLTPVTLKVAIHPDQEAFLREHSAEFRGVRITQTWLRYYKSQALAAQVLGYDGEITRNELKRMRKEGYVAGDVVGQAGVEAAYDTYLRGAPGLDQLHVDSLGRPQSAIVPVKTPQPGNAIRLTIDISLQRAAERALQYGIHLARVDGHWAANGGAIVAMDPRNGDILAMASAPTYKPSVYVGRIDLEKLKPLVNNEAAAKANYPGLDRAIQGTYPAGSTFKPVTALAAMQEHVISPSDALLCSPDFVVRGYTGHGQVFRNWTSAYDQYMTLPMALATSCDTYFYRLGYTFYGLPPDRGHPLQNWASRFGIGELTGIDIPGEVKGLLPTPEWRQQTYTKKTDANWQIDRIWKPGDSIQLAIGQKDLQVTPLQMARLYAMLANGGKLVTPHVVADVEEPRANGQPPNVLRRFDPPPPQEAGVDPNALSVVRFGLFQATHQPYGTSFGVFGNYPIPIAGKTGTAEKVVTMPGFSGVLDQSWWCGWGPYDQPTIVVCALIENGGHGGTAAAPAALRVFEQYFGKQPSSTGTVPSD
jgi:penicillin-binding protein 2